MTCSCVGLGCFEIFALIGFVCIASCLIPASSRLHRAVSDLHTIPEGEIAIRAYLFDYVVKEKDALLDFLSVTGHCLRGLVYPKLSLAAVGEFHANILVTYDLYVFQENKFEWIFIEAIFAKRPTTIGRGAWAIFPGAQPTEQPRRVPKVADRGMTFS